MTKSHTFKNDIQIALDGNDFTVIKAEDPNGNADVEIVGNHIKTVDLNVVGRKRIPKRDVVQMNASQGKVNSDAFKYAFTAVNHVDFKPISTGGGHNDATTYDEENVMLIVFGVITVRKATAKRIVEQDKNIEVLNRDLNRIDKEVKALMAEKDVVRQTAYRAERETLEV